MKLNKDAIDHLTIVHKIDVLKVLQQMMVLQKERNQCEQLQFLSEEEYNTLVTLIEKYYDGLRKLD